MIKILTKEHIKKIGIDESWYIPLIDNFNEYGVNDKNEIAMFLAQTSYESNNYKILEESFNYKADRLYEVFKKRVGSLEKARELCLKGSEEIANFVYGKRFGNAQNEGYKYRGRGIIQLTGKNNYKYYGDLIGIDLLTNPDFAKKSEISIKIALVYWYDRKCYIPARKGDVRETTLLINGGYNGIKNREKIFNKIIEILSI